ncbi:MAG: hypothetical protein AAGH42_12870, partial [Pseudomonadota bacterium]
SSSANAFFCASGAHVPMYAALQFSKNTLSKDETDFSVKFSGLWFFRFDISDLLIVVDQRTATPRLRQCPNFEG